MDINIWIFAFKEAALTCYVLSLCTKIKVERKVAHIFVVNMNFDFKWRRIVMYFLQF